MIRGKIAYGSCPCRAGVHRSCSSSTPLHRVLTCHARLSSNRARVPRYAGCDGNGTCDRAGIELERTIIGSQALNRSAHGQPDRRGPPQGGRRAGRMAADLS